jgi:hypothetical protein
VVWGETRRGPSRGFWRDFGAKVTKSSSIHETANTLANCQWPTQSSSRAMACSALAPTLGAFPRGRAPVRQPRRHGNATRGSSVPRAVPNAAAPAWLTETSSSREAVPDDVSPQAPLRVLVAGGGLGGLFAAICLRNVGCDVAVLERTSQYRPFGGPIQLASNGVSTIKAVSEKLFHNVHLVSRPFWKTTSGIRDGLKGNWMFTFGAITELPDEGDLPFSICVDRSDLQEQLLNEIGDAGVVQMKSAFSKYENVPETDGGGVLVTLEDGREIRADVLLGADGIWSKVRSQMFKEPSGVKGAGSTASFTGYKLFSGLPVFKPYYYEGTALRLSQIRRHFLLPLFYVQ